MKHTNDNAQAKFLAESEASFRQVQNKNNPKHAKTNREMFCRALINVSTYSSTNERFRRVKEEAERIVGVNEMRQVRQKCGEIFKPGVEFLAHHLRPYLRGEDAIKWTFGLYPGIGMEPSISAALTIPRSDLSSVKSCIVDFGEEFAQDNVHLLVSLVPEGKHPVEETRFVQDRDDLRLEDLEKDATAEVCWAVRFRELQCISQVAELAKAAGIAALSLKATGEELLLYSTGTRLGNIPVLPKGVAQLKSTFQAKNLICGERTWHTALYNYGNKSYDASHTYDEARLLLSSADHEELELLPREAAVSKISINTSPDVEQHHEIPNEQTVSVK